MTVSNAFPEIEPILSTTMADVVEEKLRTYFRDKGFSPGDALPKEVELAEALQVSRNVVREALSRLRMLGMIETRKRRGMILAEPDVLSGLERLLDPQLLGKDVMKQLFELRLVLEIGMGDLLFMRRKETDLQILQQIVEDELKATSHVERVECDIRFHGTLYRMTGNETLGRFQKLLVPMFQYIIENEAGPDGQTAVGAVSHAGLLAILRHGDPTSFREAMKKHLDPHFLFL
ncbi:FadR family transcriptional regulator [Larkinella rosea]|uniref:FadR family transcriptional regulator n=2 Tax=Larkinella rosea TaxID=2025312 RepID=A0A3P1BUL9_9BACT|nr:FadR family transcriptional regulator [Larkinella rosea]